MTIWLYSGTPGSGKSLDAMRKIKNALKYQKKDVIANFEVIVDESWKGNFTYLPNNELSAANLVNFAVDYWSSRKFKEDGILLVLDEAQLLWNSRNWQDKSRMSFLQFMSQHRKYGYKIILIAQSDIMIDKQFRTLIEYECNHRKLGNYGKFGFFFKLLFLGEIFYSCTYYYMQNVKVGGEWFRYNKKVASMYNSYTTFDLVESDGAQCAPSMGPNHGMIAGVNHECLNVDSDDNHVQGFEIGKVLAANRLV